MDLAVWTAFAAIQGVGGAAPMFWDQCLSAVAARAMLTPKPYLVIAASLLKEALLALALARLGLGGGRGASACGRLCARALALRALLKAVGGGRDRGAGHSHGGIEPVVEPVGRLQRVGLLCGAQLGRGLHGALLLRRHHRRPLGRPLPPPPRPRPPGELPRAFRLGRVE